MKHDGEFIEEIYTEDGKTMREEASDSARMLGCVLTAFFVALIAIVAWMLLTRPIT